MSGVPVSGVLDVNAVAGDGGAGGVRRRRATRALVASGAASVRRRYGLRVS